MRDYRVYELYKDGLLFYVGSSCNTKLRLSAHKGTYGMDIEMKIVGIYDINNNALNEEARLIELYRSQGIVLRNGVVGRPYINDKKIRVTFMATKSKVIAASNNSTSRGSTLNKDLEAALYEFASR